MSKRDLLLLAEAKPAASWAPARGCGLPSLEEEVTGGGGGGGG
jgi:hypothetical protein